MLRKSFSPFSPISEKMLELASLLTFIEFAIYLHSGLSISCNLSLLCNLSFSIPITNKHFMELSTIMAGGGRVEMVGGGIKYFGELRGSRKRFWRFTWGSVKIFCDILPKKYTSNNMAQQRHEGGWGVGNFHGFEKGHEIFLHIWRGMKTFNITEHFNPTCYNC